MNKIFIKKSISIFLLIMSIAFSLYSQDVQEETKEAEAMKATEEVKATKEVKKVEELEETQLEISPVFTKERNKKQDEKEKQSVYALKPKIAKIDFNQSLILNEFIAANLADKVLIVNFSDKNTDQSFYEKALKFALDNKEYLENYPDYYPLVLSCIRHFNFNASENVDDLLYDVYNNFSDYNVRLAVMEAFAIVKIDNPKVFTLLHDVVSKESAKKSSLRNAVLIAGLRGLENLKNPQAFELLFTILSKSYPDQIKNAAVNAIYALSPAYNQNAILVAQKGNLAEKQLILDIVTKNPKNDKNFSAEIAEILLFQTIINSGEVSRLSKEQVSLQFNSLKVLTDCKWTKATEIVLKYFELAEKEYMSLFLSEEQFIEVIKSLKEFPTTKTCKLLTDYLASQYSITMNSGEYNSNILIAVINTLGDLGDKNAFDTLLYINSWKDYSDDITNASSDALRKLKW
ncbi:MAG: HEAT repeat domain-containing protein [Treponemataceae bacterium]